MVFGWQLRGATHVPGTQGMGTVMSLYPSMAAQGSKRIEWTGVEDSIAIQSQLWIGTEILHSAGRSLTGQSRSEGRVNQPHLGVSFLMCNVQ